MVASTPILLDQTNGEASQAIIDEATAFIHALKKKKKNTILDLSNNAFSLLYLAKKKIGFLRTQVRNVVALNARRTNWGVFNTATELFRLSILSNTRLHEFLYPESYSPSAAQIAELEESWKMFTVIGNQTTAVDTRTLPLANLQQINNKQFINDAQTNLFPDITLAEYNNYMGAMFITTTPFDGIAYASSSKSSEDRIDILTALDNEHMNFTGFGVPSFFAKNYLGQKGPQYDSLLLDINVFKDVLDDWSKDISLWDSIRFTDTFTVNKTGATSVATQFTPNDPSTTHIYDVNTQIVTGEEINLQVQDTLVPGTGSFVILKETIIEDFETTKTIFCEGYIIYTREVGQFQFTTSSVLMQKNYNHRYRNSLGNNLYDEGDSTSRSTLVYMFNQDDIHFVKYISPGFPTPPLSFTFHKITLANDESASLSNFPNSSASVTDSLGSPIPAGANSGSGVDSHVREIFINENISFTLSSSQSVSYTRYPRFSDSLTVSSTIRNFSRPMGLDWEDYLSGAQMSRFTSSWSQQEITYSVYNTLFDDALVGIINPNTWNPITGGINFARLHKIIMRDSIVNSESDLAACYKGTTGLTLDPAQAGVFTSAWNSLISGSQPAVTSGSYPGSNFYIGTQVFNNFFFAATYPFVAPHPLFSMAGVYKEPSQSSNDPSPAWIRGITSLVEHKASSVENIFTSYPPTEAHENVTVSADSLSVNGQSIPIGALVPTTNATGHVIKDVSVTGYSILPEGATFRWCYLINKSGASIGVCKFYWTPTIEDLLSDYYDIQDELLAAAETRAANPNSIDSVFNSAANIRIQLDNYFNSGGMIKNDFMSYQLMHLILSSPLVIVYIYTNEE